MLAIARTCQNLQHLPYNDPALANSPSFKFKANPIDVCQNLAIIDI